MPSTRLNPSQSIAEQLLSREDLCLITKEALDVLVRENADTRREQMEIQRSIAQSLEIISRTMAESNVQSSSKSATLCQKLDDLTEVIKQSNASLSNTSTNVDQFLKQRKHITEKIARHQLLSAYYDELLNEQSPFVRREFRTKVQKMPPRRIYAIDVNRQSTI